MSKIGFGLESLIPQKKIKNNEDYSIRKESIFFIETQKIKSNPYQPRKEFNKEALKTLSESIKQHGILQPLVVSRLETNGMNVEYQLIAGERRLMASKLANVKQVPVIIREPGNKEKLVLSLIENVQRQDLNSIEKAEAYRQLMKEFNLLQKDIARLVGKSKESVSNSLRLLQLPEKIKLSVKKMIITEGHAKVLLSIKDRKKLEEVFNKVVKDNLSVRETENICSKIGVPNSKKGFSLDEVSNVKLLTKKIEKSLDGIPGIFKFKFKKSGGMPVITIYFENETNFNKFIGGLSD